MTGREAPARAMGPSSNFSNVGADSPRDPEYMTTEEVANACRTSPSTVRYWRSERTGPPSFKVGRKVLYPQDGFRSWLREQQVLDRDRRQ